MFNLQRFSNFSVPYDLRQQQQQPYYSVRYELEYVLGVVHGSEIIFIKFDLRQLSVPEL